MVEICAEMGGFVVDIAAAVGVRVSAGQTLMILESMKMQIPVNSPCAGRVREIRVCVDDVVQFGDVLMIIDERNTPS
jgi:acetyl-CoA carboxylase biotin carboxyl carrier protein